MTSPHVLQSGQSFTFPDTEDSYDFLFKVVLIGDAGVGKTCVVQRFKHGIYMERHGNTIGVDFMLKTIEVDGKKIKVLNSVLCSGAWGVCLWGCASI